MNLRSLKQIKNLSTIEQNKKCKINNKILGFQDLCIEITRQQIDDLTIGKFVVRNLSVVKKN